MTTCKKADDKIKTAESTPEKKTTRRRTTKKVSKSEEVVSNASDETASTDRGIVDSNPCEMLTLSSDIMDEKDLADAATLSRCLWTIQNVALEVHEKFELRGIPVMRLFEQVFCSQFKRYEWSVMWTAIWNFSLFTKARLVCQQNFQDRVVAALPDAEHAFIMRQMLCNAPRAWSYRRSYQRSFAHTISGPLKTQEFSVNGSMMTYGRIHDAAHIYALGWTITFHDKTWLVCAAELTREQAFAIESMKPYPVYKKDDLFWEEQFVNIVQTIYEPIAILNNTASTRPAEKMTGYSPESFFAGVQKLVVRQMNSAGYSDSVVGASDLHEIVATESPSGILLATKACVNRFINSDQFAYEERLLDAYGCDATGNMPLLPPASVANDPVALLLLQEDHPIFKFVHERDSIKNAIVAEQQNLENAHDVREAFDRYMIERRWLHSYSAFDLADEDHASIVGLPTDTIRRVFDKRLFETRISFVPQGDYATQLRDKFGFYATEDDQPTFAELLDALMSRKIQRGAAMAPLVQWLFQVCERWRYCRADVEAATPYVRRNLDQNSQKMLSNGLKGLAAMFKKKS